MVTLCGTTAEHGYQPNFEHSALNKTRSDRYSAEIRRKQEMFKSSSFSNWKFYEYFMKLQISVCRSGLPRNSGGPKENQTSSSQSGISKLYYSNWTNPSLIIPPNSWRSF
ncbi:hypothetical protein Zmor_005272 [Zophobas morio]|uniref:Uncharacterized protein n=1 Tax=Zophobas morio TaxID=2755281 RepID=A0AA38ISM5_9CUCU|nr:hypothetical protein Zmor_005272 [Zophobas morio]